MNVYIPDNAFIEKVRPLILKRDNCRCVICGKYSRIVHHIDGNERNSKFTNAVVVCPHHHSHKEGIREKLNKIAKEREVIIMNILNRRMRQKEKQVLL